MRITSVKKLKEHKNKQNIDEIIIIGQKIENPSELWDLVLKCENLKTLFLYETQLTGEIPEIIGNLVNLNS